MAMGRLLSVPIYRSVVMWGSTQSVRAHIAVCPPSIQRWRRRKTWAPIHTDSPDMTNTQRLEYKWPRFVCLQQLHRWFVPSAVQWHEYRNRDMTPPPNPLAMWVSLSADDLCEADRLANVKMMEKMRSVGLRVFTSSRASSCRWGGWGVIWEYIEDWMSWKGVYILIHMLHMLGTSRWIPMRNPIIRQE